MNGGKAKWASDLTSSHKAKQDICAKPQRLKQSEIESLRADLKSSVATLEQLMKTQATEE